MARADKSNRRQSERFKITTLSKLDNTECSIINVSKDGMLLCGNAEGNQRNVSIQLKINGKWVDLSGTRMWSMDSGASHCNRMGVFITKAPPEYRDFVNNLYLEADTRK